MFFKTQEGIIIKNHFKKYDFDFIIDLHETGSTGNFIYNYSKANSTKAGELINFLTDHSLKIENGYKDHVYETENGILFFPPHVIYLQSVFSRSPLAHYFYINDNKLSFTFESSIKEAFDKRIKAHKCVISFFLEK